MTGRRGRPANVPAAGIQWHPDVTIVKPTSDPQELDVRVFELQDATVYNKDGTTLENALELVVKGPFIVRGNLCVDEPKQREWLLKNVKSSVAIESPQCISYSIAEAPGLYPILYLAGQSCWYEIQPSPQYLPFYRHACGGIKMFYVMLDLYKNITIKELNKLTSKSSDPIQRIAPLLHKYTVQVGEALTLEEAVDRCDEHAIFLLCQFKQDKAIQWNRTYMCQWLSARHPDLVKKIPDHFPHAVVGELAAPAESTHVASTPVVGSKEANTRQRSSRSTSTFSQQKENLPTLNVEEPKASTHRGQALEMRQRSSRSRSTVVDHESTSAQEPRPSNSLGKSSTPSNTSDKDNAALASLVDAINIVTADDVGRDQVIKIRSVLSKLYISFSFKSAPKFSHTAPIKDVIGYNAKGLLKSLNKSKFQGEFWSWLEELARSPPQLQFHKPSDFPFFVARRKSNTAKVTKATAAKTALPKPGDDDEDSEKDHSPEPSRLGKGMKRPAGKRTSSTSVLRPAMSSRKRLRADLDSDEESQASTNARQSHFFQKEDQIMADADEAGSPGQEPIKVIIHAEKIQSTVPKGPDNTWSCELEECHYFVRGDDEARCQEQIRHHFEQHQQQSQRVQLAVKEGTKGHAPINHLLEKLKKQGESSRNKEQISHNGTLLPRPIKKSLIV